MGQAKPTVVLTEVEAAEMLSIFLHVCGAVKLAALRKWWATKVPKFLQKFMDTLKHCVLAARYVGKNELAKLARIAGNAAADPTVVKKHKEKLDSFAARYKSGPGGAPARAQSGKPSTLCDTPFPGVSRVNICFTNSCAPCRFG
jgi:hypothetical protein